MGKKVCVVITARPSYSRIKTALKSIDEHPDLELQLVIAASALLDRYGSAVNFIEEDGFKIDERVYMVIEGSTLASAAKTTGIGIMELSTVFDNLRPDMVITIADRFETMSTAIAASYMNIPLVHIQGGEVTGNIDEKVRHAITKLSDLHLVSNEDAKNRLIRMGEHEETVFVTGCPSIDLVREVMESPNLDFDPCEKYGGVGSYINPNEDFMVVMQHPVTTEIDESRHQTEILIHEVAKMHVPVFWFWPNPDAGSDGTSNAIRTYREQNPNNKFRFFKNMEGRDFLRLLYASRCLVGNSSAGIRECSFMGVPVVNLGSRQNMRLRGPNVIDCGFQNNELSHALQSQFSHGLYEPAFLYGDGYAAQKIANLVATITPDFKKVISY
ncbi:MAG: UDP-N-acetylglucosamine 2-epimerase [Flavobacteriales bacterium]|nr:UDP-N-acetylglucosamine 2-epimerase [Flavobacteriales bacterium]